MLRSVLRIFIGATIAIFALSFTAHAAEKITVLFPAPLELPSFATWQVANYEGYYRSAGLDVQFLTGHGGADAAVQAGAGNVDVAVALGDAAIIVRSRGVPVRDIAVLGGGGFLIVAGRVDAGVKTLRDLKHKAISVIGYQDSTYFTLLEMLGTVHLSKRDVNVQALGPAGTVQFFVNGNVQACACDPEWITTAENAGVKMNLFPSADYVPSLAQGMIASDQLLKERPRVVRRFVDATLRAFIEMRDHPTEMAKIYVKAVPIHKGKEDFLGRVFTYYAKWVWQNQRVAGMADPAAFRKVQDFYAELGVIRHKSPVEDLYTNAFVENAAAK